MATYYFRGNRVLGARLIAELENKGGYNKYHLRGENRSMIYTIHPISTCITGELAGSLASLLIQKYGKEIIPQEVNDHIRVQEDDYVLVRNASCDSWQLTKFIKQCGLDSDLPGLFLCGGGGIWAYCIPYKGNEALFGTTNNAPRGVEYIYD